MIPLPLQPKIIEKKANLAVFQIEGLWPGYGVTVGNSLRRVLLSSLEGAAVTKTRIVGVQHEFSTIPGVLEDVITIILNLKQLRFKLFGEEPQRARLLVKGEKEVRGSDFELPSQLEMMNKSAHVATITNKNARLEIEIQVEKGLRYLPKELQETKDLAIGEIPLDAFFTPVRKVSYRVENMRVGKRTDFDRLNLEIETDGSIAPEEAFQKASEILFNHFSFLFEAFKKPPVEDMEEKETGPEAVKKEKTGKIKIEDLKLSSRTISALLKSNIKTVGGIVRRSETSLSELDELGEKGIKEIKKALKKLGIELKQT